VQLFNIVQEKRHFTGGDSIHVHAGYGEQQTFLGIQQDTFVGNFDGGSQRLVMPHKHGGD